MDAFFEELPIAFRSKELVFPELEEYPIFEEVRADSRFSKISKKQKSSRKVSPQK
jgi:hypothetical protein